MAFTHVITNAVAVLKAAGYKESDNRTPINAQSEMGADGRFQVSADPVTEVLAQHGISANIRNALLHVQVEFFQGGGDMGGAAHGGDLKHVDARALETTLAMVALLENQHSYDAQNTGIRRRRWRDSSVFATGERSVTWEILMDVEWEEPEKAQAVAA